MNLCLDTPFLQFLFHFISVLHLNHIDMKHMTMLIIDMRGFLMVNLQDDCCNI